MVAEVMGPIEAMRTLESESVPTAETRLSAQDELVNVTLDSPTVYLVPAWIALVSVVLLVRHPGLLPIDPAPPAADGDRSPS